MTAALKIDPQTYGSQGGAVLGIRDSGKSYTATKIAEQLFDANIPFVAFDPIGLWRFMRVPGKGKGYPVVVAGGEEPDLPLTPNNAAAITRAAMQNGVSLVIDLFDPHLSKADWKRIVLASIQTLLFENKEYGLRHLFIEEAAEFVPQIIPNDGVTGHVYSMIERLARMGGNRRLGYTLINQRAEQVNKAVLELCDNLFLHRQKGKNSITSLRKWLDVAGVADASVIMESLPTLPQGECWEWLAGETHARLVRVPAKNSFHPDRRLMAGHGEATLPRRVDAAKFVAGLKDKLGQIEAEASANDPAKLKAEVARLKTELQKVAQIGNAPARVDEAALAAAEQQGYDRGHAEGYNEGKSAVFDAAWAAVEKAQNAVHALSDDLRLAKSKVPDKRVPAPHTKPRTNYAPSYASVAQPAERRGAIPKVASSNLAGRSNGSDELSGPQRRVLASLGFWKSIGHDEPTRPQIAAIAGYAHTSGSFRNIISSLNSAGLISTPVTGCLSLTERAPYDSLDSRQARDLLFSIMDGPQKRVVEVLLTGATETRESVAARSGYEPTSGSFRNIISSLNVLGVLTKPSAGAVRISDWAAEVLR